MLGESNWRNLHALNLADAPGASIFKLSKPLMFPDNRKTRQQAKVKSSDDRKRRIHLLFAFPIKTKP
jgi:hypothetical protein